MAEACCPASCGELIQGLINGSEKLISCPIDWYSTVEVKQGTAHQFDERPLMRRAVKAALKHLQIDESWHQKLSIRFNSTIPVAKGMASSTADIAATAVATARHFEQELSNQALAQICTSLEPSDSTFLHQLSLFDHHRGEIHRQFEWVPDLNVLIFESPTQLNTADYHRIPRQQRLKQNENRLASAIRLFEQAIQTKDVTLFGKACTQSAIASQYILAKPGFEQFQTLIEKFDLPGMIVAHSGTVVGLLCDPQQHDPDAIFTTIHHSVLQTHYPMRYMKKLIAGGVI
ncbi:GHMP kinase [uncultured Tolumonas sp.]|uniref:GHMP family kinase ATP-binding protein n=1 Tax=uncultured Tolumonas sp. TaxID=263765 RepID=UPI002A0A61DA|nr:GHMP kinase [uncultured Tolumonas sp.]